MEREKKKRLAIVLNESNILYDWAKVDDCAHHQRYTPCKVIICIQLLKFLWVFYFFNCYNLIARYMHIKINECKHEWNFFHTLTTHTHIRTYMTVVCRSSTLFVNFNNFNSVVCICVSFLLSRCIFAIHLKYYTSNNNKLCGH